jgi:hypothetical protein
MHFNEKTISAKAVELFYAFDIQGMNIPFYTIAFLWEKILAILS